MASSTVSITTSFALATVALQRRYPEYRQEIQRRWTQRRNLRNPHSTAHMFLTC